MGVGRNNRPMSRDRGSLIPVRPIVRNPMPNHLFEIQIRQGPDSAWLFVEPCHDAGVATRRASTLNRESESSTAAHRVVRKTDERVIYLCGIGAAFMFDLSGRERISSIDRLGVLRSGDRMGHDDGLADEKRTGA